MKRKKEIIVMSAISCFVAILVLAAATTAWYTGDASAAKLNGLELSVGRTENLKVAKTAGRLSEN